MKRYYIEDVKCGITKGGFGCGPIDGNIVTTVKFNDGERSQWLNLIEVAGIANTYLTDKDVFAAAIKEDFEDKAYWDYMHNHHIETFNGLTISGDYNEIVCDFSDEDNPAVPLIRYLLALTRCDLEETDDMISMGKGHYVDELDIPMSDVEKYFSDEDFDDEDLDEDGEDKTKGNEPVISTDLERQYRLRLFFETEVNTPSVFHDIDSRTFEMAKGNLAGLLEKCTSERDYHTWKNAYLAKEYEKLRGKRFVKCKYAFAGLGQYEEIMPEEAVSRFKRWIDANGSAFFGGEEDATEADIKKYVALQIANTDCGYFARRYM